MTVRTVLLLVPSVIITMFMLSMTKEATHLTVIKSSFFANWGAK